jgi:hypothetical protein
MDEVDRRVDADIARFGWHVALVPPAEHASGWAFTIGLQQSFGHPELAVFGVDLKLLHQLVNRVGERIRAGARFEAGRRYEGLVRGYACGFRSVQPRWLDAFWVRLLWNDRDFA